MNEHCARSHPVPSSFTITRSLQLSQHLVSSSHSSPASTWPLPHACRWTQTPVLHTPDVASGRAHEVPSATKPAPAARKPSRLSRRSVDDVDSTERQLSAPPSTTAQASRHCSSAAIGQRSVLSSPRIAWQKGDESTHSPLAQ